MGVVRKRARPFLSFSGNVPMLAKQMKLDLFKERPKTDGTSVKMAGPTPLTTAPCGEERSCNDCPLCGAAGHTGYQEAKAA